MNTPTQHPSMSSTPANSKRKTNVPAADPAVRHVRPKWDPKKPALMQLFEAEQDAERRRPYLKGAAADKAAEIRLGVIQQGPDRETTALLSSVVATMEVLRKDQEKGVTWDDLPSKEAEYIPLVFQNLIKFCDNAKSAADLEKSYKEMDGIKRKLKEQEKQMNHDSQVLGGLRQERDKLSKDNHSLTAKALELHMERDTLVEEKKTYLRLRKDKRAREPLLSEVKTQVELERDTLLAEKAILLAERPTLVSRRKYEMLGKSEDHYRSLYHNMCDTTTALRKECGYLELTTQQLRGELKEAQGQELSFASHLKHICQINKAKDQLNEMKTRCQSHEEEIEKLQSVNRTNREAFNRQLAELKQKHLHDLTDLQVATDKEQWEMQRQLDELTQASDRTATELGDLKHKLAKADAAQTKLCKRHKTEMKQAKMRCSATHDSTLKERLQQLEREKNAERDSLIEAQKEEKASLQEAAAQDRQRRLTEQQERLRDIYHHSINGLEKKCDEQLAALWKWSNEHAHEQNQKVATKQHRIERLESVHHTDALNIANLKAAASKSAKDHSQELRIERKVVQEARATLTGNQALTITYLTALVEARALLAKRRIRLDKTGSVLLRVMESDYKKGRAVEKLQVGLGKVQSDAMEMQSYMEAHVKTLLGDIKAKDTSLDIINSELAVYEAERQFQLGRFDRTTLFNAFSDHARHILGGQSFSGEIGGQLVNVCICFSPDTGEVLLLVQRCNDDAYMIWQSKVEDYTAFTYQWRVWVRISRGMHEHPFYISMDPGDKTWEWLKPLLSVWTLSEEEKVLLKNGRK